MSEEPLTIEEHEARAMLLGKVYDRRDHTYSRSLNNLPVAWDMVDAGTLEPITVEQSNARIDKFKGKSNHGD